jgi:predicted enzyme related to lactoylglutathione lyase
MSSQNVIGWFDLYVTDMDRAAAFYEAVLQRALQPMGDPTGETVMRGFPADMAQYGAAGALVKSAHGQPGAGGSLLYFTVDDCAVAAARAAQAGGTIVRPKFSIGEFGWVALCIDTEGNLIGFSSLH